MMIPLACPDCGRRFPTPASGEPWTIPANVSPCCSAFTARMLLPQGRADRTSNRSPQSGGDLTGRRALSQLNDVTSDDGAQDDSGDPSAGLTHGSLCGHFPSRSRLS